MNVMITVVKNSTVNSAVVLKEELVIVVSVVAVRVSAVQTVRSQYSRINAGLNMGSFATTTETV